ncbi:MAG: hypothetical protein HPY81_09625 [Firmicutes bacterium]|nr:hypothetical protein [Bacillota bacterium]
MTYEMLVENLLKLPPAEMIKVIEAVIKQLLARHDTGLAREIIERYRLALEELAHM